MNEYTARRGESKAPFRTAAAWYRSIGWTGTIPVTRRGTKAPLAKGITGHAGVDATDEQLLALIREFPTANIGIRLPWDIIGIDVDAYDGRHGLQTMILKARELKCPLPMTFRSTSRAPEDNISGIYLFRARRESTEVWKTILGNGVEIAQFHHRFATVAPSIHNTTGLPYRWWFGNEIVNPPHPEDLTELPEEWNLDLLSDNKYMPMDSASSEQVLKWYAMVSSGHMCQFMDDAVHTEAEKIRASIVLGGLHDTLVAATTYLCMNASEGHRGLDMALSILEDRFMSAGRRRNLQSEWKNAVNTAMSKAAALPQEETDVCSLRAEWRRKS
jgi:hypothetical protein